jgi:hypothetical protein
VAKDYAERGIEVCQEWMAFDAFLAYAKGTLGVPDLSDGTRWTLDRRNNDRGYEPGNIRWATYKQNIRNRRSSRWVEYLGEHMLLVELSERTQMPYRILSERICRSGWTAERAVAEPIERRRTATLSTDMAIAHDGRVQSLHAWSLELGFDAAKVRRRLVQGWDFTRAVSQPPDRTSGARSRARVVIVNGEPATLRDLAVASGVSESTLRYRIDSLGMSPKDAATPGHLKHATRPT